MKKFLAIAFAVMMVMSISGAASAASEPSGCCNPRGICCVPY
ncbi:hypothetical protein [Brevibacillus daliensis]|nr:hypothetical protein [Brevibacillus daliensis]